MEYGCQSHYHLIPISVQIVDKIDRQTYRQTDSQKVYLAKITDVQNIEEYDMIGLLL